MLVHMTTVDQQASDSFEHKVGNFESDAKTNRQTMSRQIRHFHVRTSTFTLTDRQMFRHYITLHN